jgi:thiamine-phosphate pyrophosphorylase
MTLTELATRLNSRHPMGKSLPAVLLMTDEVRLPDPLPAVAALPRGAGVILRHYNDPNRPDLARELASLCRHHGLYLLIAGDGGMAMRVTAHGVHFPEWRAAESRQWRQRCPHWLITAAAHSYRSLISAVHNGSDAAILGPVFSTESHPGSKPLGVVRFAALIAAAQRTRCGYPVYALGGMNSKTARRISNSGAVGIVGISGVARP